MRLTVVKDNSSLRILWANEIEQWGTEQFLIRTEAGNLAIFRARPASPELKTLIHEMPIAFTTNFETLSLVYVRNRAVGRYYCFCDDLVGYMFDPPDKLPAYWCEVPYL